MSMSGRVLQSSISIELGLVSSARFSSCVDQEMQSDTGQAYHIGNDPKPTHTSSRSLRLEKSQFHSISETLLT